MGDVSSTSTEDFPECSHLRCECETALGGNGVSPPGGSSCTSKTIRAWLPLPRSQVLFPQAIFSTLSLLERITVSSGLCNSSLQRVEQG